MVLYGFYHSPCKNLSDWTRGSTDVVLMGGRFVLRNASSTKNFIDDYLNNDNDVNGTQAPRMLVITGDGWGVQDLTLFH